MKELILVTSSVAVNLDELVKCGYQESVFFIT